MASIVDQINAMPSGADRIRAAYAAQASGALPPGSIILQDGSITPVSGGIDTKSIQVAADAVESIIDEKPNTASARGPSRT